MGFGFNLAIAFVFPVLFLVSIGVLIYAIGSKNFSIIRKLLLGWGLLLAIPVTLGITVIVINFFTAKKQLKRDDIFGSYVIDRSMYPGKQSDWQYSHYRFEIAKPDLFRFYIIDRNKTLKVIRGKIKFLDGYEYRLKINANVNGPKVIDPEPTLCRRIFSFYYVFNSRLYHNMFFTKGEWKPIEPAN